MKPKVLLILPAAAHLRVDAARPNAPRRAMLRFSILPPLPGTPLYATFQRAGRIVSTDWSRYDFRHVIIEPARLTRQELQDGADWLYHQFYRLDRILWRFCRGLVTLGPMPALWGLKLGLTYRYDNRREGITGRNPAAAQSAPSHWQHWVRRFGETIALTAPPASRFPG